MRPAVKSGHSTVNERYKCVGCAQEWTQRHRDRILKHARICGGLSRDLRRRAVVAQGNMAPMSQLAQLQEQLQPTVEPTPMKHMGDHSSQSVGAKDQLFGRLGRKHLKHKADHETVVLFCVAGLPPNLLSYPEYKQLSYTLNSSYHPMSRSTLTDSAIPATQAVVQKEQLTYLQTQLHLTVTFDGGSIRKKNGFYSVHVLTQDGRAFLMDMADGRGASHTGEWIKGVLRKTIDEIGSARFAGVSSDNTGNTRVARRELCAELPLIINCPDAVHHINLLIKDICKLDYFQASIRIIKKTIAHFSHSNDSTEKLDRLRKLHKVPRKLQQVGKTRFATIPISAESVKDCLVLLRQLVTDGEIDLGEWAQYYTAGTATTLQFELALNQFIAINYAPTRTIACLEAASTNPATVLRFWLAMIAHVKKSLDDRTFAIREDVQQQVRGLVNFRYKEYYEDGPTPVHLAALYLDPSCVRSDIFRRPNAMATTLVIPAKGASPRSKVPEGVKHPKVWLKVANFVAEVAAKEIKHGINPEFTKWRERGPDAFKKAIVRQFTAYSLGFFPFHLPLMEGESVQAWWARLAGSEDAGLLAAVVIKFYSITPTSKRANQDIATIIVVPEILPSQPYRQIPRHQRRV